MTDEQTRSTELWQRIEIAQNLLKLRELEARKAEQESEKSRIKGLFTIDMLERIANEAEAKLNGDNRKPPKPLPSPIDPPKPEGHHCCHNHSSNDTSGAEARDPPGDMYT